jgi:hypothetical protein
VTSALAAAGNLGVETTLLASAVERGLAADEQTVQVVLEVVTELVARAPEFRESLVTEKMVREVEQVMAKRKPFPGVRAFAWRLLAVMTPGLANAQILDECVLRGELVKLLADFRSEENYEARLGKWEFVAALVKSSKLEGLDASLVRKLREYAAVGLGYAPLEGGENVKIATV